MTDEVALQSSGGRRIVRVGNTVRRPTLPWSEDVHRLLERLEAVDFPYSPRFLGLDDQGREVLTFIDGVCGSDRLSQGAEEGAEVWAMVASDEGLRRFARLLRTFHDAIDGQVCHNDFGPWNVVWREGHPVGIIDWDFAAPGEPIRDVAYALEWAVPFCDDAECMRWRRFEAPPDRMHRIAVFADAYGLPSVEGLVDAVIARQRETAMQVRDLANQGIQPQSGWVAEGYMEVLDQRTAWSEANRPLLELSPPR